MKLRALILDDTPENSDLIVIRLTRQFVGFGWPIEWEKFDDPDEALQAIDLHAAYDVAVIDLLFERPDLAGQYEPRGLEIIKDLRARSEHTFIFAISSAIDADWPDLFDKARREGANHVARRSQFSNRSEANSPTAVAAAARTLLLNNGTVPSLEVNSDPNDPAVQSLINDVGEHTISQLYRMILEADGHTTQAVHISALNQGASGANVCGVRASVENLGTLRHVLKLSRDAHILDREAARSQLASKLISSRFLVRIHPPRPVGGVNGWYAIGAQLQSSAVTLRSWLSRNPPNNQIEDLLEALFVECLGSVFAERPSPADICPLDWFRFPQYRQRLILHAMAELGGALTRPDGPRLDNASVILTEVENYVRDCHHGNLPRHRLPNRTVVTHAHGDLHGGNVLVYDGRHAAPTLIDTSEFDVAHWATDPARLAVDLLMRSFDPGVESMFFKDFASWRALAGNIGDLTPTEALPVRTPSGQATLVALNWLVTNIGRWSAPVSDNAGLREHHWEWRLAYIGYLLRSTYHYELPPPKRALAIVAAHNQLTMLAAPDP